MLKRHCISPIVGTSKFYDEIFKNQYVVIYSIIPHKDYKAVWTLSSWYASEECGAVLLELCKNNVTVLFVWIDLTGWLYDLEDQNRIGGDPYRKQSNLNY